MLYGARLKKQNILFTNEGKADVQRKKVYYGAVPL